MNIDPKQAEGSDEETAWTRIWTSFAARLFSLSRIGADGSLERILSLHVRFVPIIIALALLCSLLEAFGVALLIPLVSVLTGNGLETRAPWPVSAAIGSLGGLAAEQAVLAIGLLMLVAVFVKGAIRTANASLIASVENRAGHAVRTEAVRRLLSADYAFFLQHERSRLLKILDSDSWYGVQTVRDRLDAIVALVAVVVIVLLLIWIDWRLSLLVGAAIGVSRFVQMLIERRVRRLGNEVAAVNGKLHAQMVVAVDAARPIRIYGQEEAQQRRFAAPSEEIARLLERLEETKSWTVPTVEALFAAVVIAILALTVWQDLSFAAVAAFLVLLYRSQPHFAELVSARSRIAANLGCLHEVEWLLAQENSPTPDPPDAVACHSLAEPIVFASVGYRYPNRGSALEGVSFSIRPGVSTALIGASGSGKSTVVNLICRLIAPTEGQISLDGTPAERIRRADWMGRLALAGQDIELVNGSVAFNIAYGDPLASQERIEEAAGLAFADEFIGRLPQGYETIVGEGGLSLSGGQRQRIGLARALLRKPDLLILDEATSAVDALAEGEIMRLLSQRSHFRTALVISHRYSTLLACEEGIVLENGRVAESGPLARLSYFKQMNGSEGLRQ